MTDRLHLPQRYRRILEALLREHVPDAEVWAYGSRITGESHEGSDLDLVARGPELKPLGDGFFELLEAIESSNIPILVQAHDWARLPESFHAEIERDYVVVQAGAKMTDMGVFEDWREVRLGECSVINDSTYSPKEAWPVINYLDTGNISENRVSEIQKFQVGKHKIPSRARRKVQPGDIVYSTVRPNQRHHGLLRTVPEHFLASTGFAVLRGRDGIADTGFLYWFLAQDQIVDYLHSIAENSTSAYPSLRPSDLEQLPLKLPPLSEQRTIAHVLGTLDDKIELNRRTNETLEEMARALFKSWFVDFLPVRAKQRARTQTGDPVRAKAALTTPAAEASDWTVERARAYLDSMDKSVVDLFPDRLVESELGEIPEGWEIKKIEEIAERVAMGPFGSSIKVSTFVDKGIPVISGQHVNEMLLSDNGYRFITADHARRLANANVKRGDVIFTHAGNIGQVAYIPETSQFKRYVISQRQFYMRCDSSKISPLFIVHFFKTDLGQHQLLANASSTGVPSISRPVTYLRSIELCIPPMVLCCEFGKMAELLHMKAAGNATESRTLAAQRDSLLPSLLSGDIRVDGEQTTTEKVRQ